MNGVRQKIPDWMISNAAISSHRSSGETLCTIGIGARQRFLTDSAHCDAATFSRSWYVARLRIPARNHRAENGNGVSCTLRFPLSRMPGFESERVCV